MHGLGVVCGLAAGVWLGGAEAPTKLVNIGISPFAVSLAMVLGVFVARWTLPTLLKGTADRQGFLSSSGIGAASLGAPCWRCEGTKR